MEGNSCVWQPQKIIAVFPMRFKENSDVIIATAFFQVRAWYDMIYSVLFLSMMDFFVLCSFLLFTFSRNLWMWEVLKNGPKYLLAPGHPFLLQNWEENLLKIWAPMEDLSLLVSLLLSTTSLHKHKYSRSKYFIFNTPTCTFDHAF